MRHLLPWRRRTTASPDYPPPLPSGCSFLEDAASVNARLEAIAREAVQDRLVAYVQIGVALLGVAGSLLSSHAVAGLLLVICFFLLHTVRQVCYAGHKRSVVFRLRAAYARSAGLEPTPPTPPEGREGQVIPFPLRRRSTPRNGTGG